MMITFAIAYEVITQLTSSILTPKLPDISFNATLTIEVSINSMIAADTVVITIIALAKPLSAAI